MMTFKEDLNVREREKRTEKYENTNRSYHIMWVRIKKERAEEQKRNND